MLFPFLSHLSPLSRYLRNALYCYLPFISCTFLFLIIILPFSSSSPVLFNEQAQEKGAITAYGPRTVPSLSILKYLPSPWYFPLPVVPLGLPFLHFLTASRFFINLSFIMYIYVMIKLTTFRALCFSLLSNSKNVWKVKSLEILCKNRLCDTHLPKISYPFIFFTAVTWHTYYICDLRAQGN